MFRRCPQNLAHITALGVARANAVGPVGQRKISVETMVNDDFRLSRKTMDMTRLMVLRISDETDIAETKRCHGMSITQATWVINPDPWRNIPSQTKFWSGDQKPTCVLLN